MKISTCAIGALMVLCTQALAQTPAQTPAQPATTPKGTKLTTLGDNPEDYGLRKLQKAGDPKTFPRLSNGHPDFTGIWYAGSKDLTESYDNIHTFPLTPDYLAVFKKRLDATASGNPYLDYVSTCQAFGMPRLMSYGNLEFAARPEELWVMSEALHEVRRIFLDGKPHESTTGPRFDGISTGTWQGDTLVVTTKDLRAGYLDFSGAPHSDKMTIVERIRFINKNQIQNDIAVTDPVALTHTFNVVERYDRRPPGFDIDEYICEENNRGFGDTSSQPDQDPAAMLPASAQSDN